MLEGNVRREQEKANTTTNKLADMLKLVTQCLISSTQHFNI